ncbi:hypothetical protein BCR35DRAFT_335555 [Leucosporidium creatinivorum]|uniref:PWWP domain-containing protein n=1 Tax=Leucosporidium creatinivorum TaxID=106004 RepID=A0A1Y2D8Z0_9BASI|nr:hypothetical protein BCR35DRAFT_335555 [Leucosporidium creatinivorum]
MPPKGVSAGADKTYLVGDVVLAKVKGYPSWPGQIIDNDMAPPNVKRDKPTKTKTTYLVRFFPTGDYAWTASRDLSSLTTREIEAYVSSPAKKSGDLLQAYKIARDPTEWQRQRDEAQAEYEELQARAMEFDTEDQLASAGEEERKSVGGKKRKSESGKSVASEGKKKKAKVEQGGKSKAAGASGKKSGYSDDEPERPVKKSKPVDDNEDPGLKQVRDWRHKLQKAFISKDQIVNPDDMPKCNEYFNAMEVFDMNKEWLAESKLAKVLKRICLLKPGEIPDNDRFKFQERSSALAIKWSQAANANGVAPSSSTTTTNAGAILPPPPPAPQAEPTPDLTPAPAVGGGAEDKPPVVGGVENGTKVEQEGTTNGASGEEKAAEQPVVA